MDLRAGCAQRPARRAASRAASPVSRSPPPRGTTRAPGDVGPRATADALAGAQARPAAPATPATRSSSPRSPAVGKRISAAKWTCSDRRRSLQTVSLLDSNLPPPQRASRRTPPPLGACSRDALARGGWQRIWGRYEPARGRCRERGASDGRGWSGPVVSRAHITGIARPAGSQVVSRSAAESASLRERGAGDGDRACAPLLGLSRQREGGS